MGVNSVGSACRSCSVPLAAVRWRRFRFLPWFGRSAVNELARTVLTNTLASVIGHGRTVARQASIVLAVNRDTLDLARRLGSRRTELFLESGIDRSLVNERPDRDWVAPRLELLWVGRMFPRKGLRLGLEALARVPQRIPVHLTVLGDGPELDRLKRLAATLDVADRVTWRGRVAWDEVMRAMDRAHLLLFTSLRETFGAQLLEALARGLPVLTLDHHGAADHVPDAAAIKVPVERPVQVRDAIADAIERAAATGFFCKRCRTSARRGRSSRRGTRRRRARRRSTTRSSPTPGRGPMR